ncbi:MAG: hypothetical protein GEU82_05845 [Luteitalea sp.]|nr:hypothetical protein [Luteitalea sp.]
MTKAFFGLALLGLAGLWALDVYHDYLAVQPFAFTMPFWHHLFALVAGASTAGVLFETVARKNILRDFTKRLLNVKELVALFADEERQKWVGEVIDAQIAGDVGQSLSRAIFCDVVQPFMEKRKFRSRMSYSITMCDAPSAGWKYESIELDAKAFLSVQVDFDVSQRLPPSVTKNKAVNVSLVFGASPGDLQSAFDDQACVYREHVTLPMNEANSVSWTKFGNQVRKGEVELSALGLAVSMMIDNNAQPHSRIELVDRALRIWFPYDGGEHTELFVRLVAPYPKSMKYFEVVFGEPTASPRVTFRPGTVAAPRDLTVLDFLQGQRRLRPNRVNSEKAVDVTFQPAPTENVSVESGPDARNWILPRSGLLFLWS